MPPLIRLERVSKSYDEAGRARVVLDKASTTVAHGEFLAIRGRSGSGKSTVLNLVAGVDSPSEGDIFVGPACINRLSPHDRALLRRDRIGFVFQFFNLIPTLTAIENVALSMELRGVPRREGRERAAAMLERVGLAERAGAFPDRLSGGEQQRIAIARAVVHGPDLVLADEPTGNLDDRTGEAALDLLEELTRGTHKALLLATHNPQVAARANREISVEGGQLVPLRG